MFRWLVVAILVISSCGASAAAACPGPDPGDVVTQGDIDAWLLVWQRREGLQDWHITARIAFPAELPSGILGDVEYRPVSRTAAIRVLSAADLERFYGYAPDSVRYESEETIVHELMHLLMAPLGQPRNLSHEDTLRADVVTDTLSRMLLGRIVPGGMPEAQYIDGQLARLPFSPLPEAKKEFMVKLVRAMDAVAEDDAATPPQTAEVTPWVDYGVPVQRPAQQRPVWTYRAPCSCRVWVIYVIRRR